MRFASLIDGRVVVLRRMSEFGLIGDEDNLIDWCVGAEWEGWCVARSVVVRALHGARVTCIELGCFLQQAGLCV
jgi:hypothetical protein